MERFWRVSQKRRILPPCWGTARQNNVVAWPCYPGVLMWAPTPLMAWYCDQSHLIIRKRWTLSQSFTWFPLLPASLFYPFCLLFDTYSWFYSFIVLQWVLAMSRYFLPHISEFNVDFFFNGDSGVILTSRATCHSSADLLWLPVAGHLDFALMRAWKERVMFRYSNQNILLTYL